MYISKLRLWNFRKYSSDTFNIDTPHLEVPFNDRLNILIGENDTGKSSIIDAVRILLKTHSGEYCKLASDDFHSDKLRVRIEVIFDDLSDEEAKNFTEWLSWEGEGENAKAFLLVFLDATRTEDRILPFDVKAGIDEGYILTAEAKDKLKTTYLRPLRDAKNELVPRRNSRLSQILSTHAAFQGKEADHPFVKSYQDLNKHIEAYFRGEKSDGSAADDDLGKLLKSIIDGYLREFSDKSSRFETNDSSLKSILESLSLSFEDGTNLGLGSHNLLVIASELLHLQKANWDGLRLGLIEEIEAHLHPQVQLQVIETINSKAENVQLFFTTHSPNIGSKVKLANIIICQGAKAFPMSKEYTKLAATDYTYLERFLDITKANLFFAKGVVLVEGWAEELIMPVLAKKININLTAKGVSIINIGNTAFLRFAKVFQRVNDPQMETPVAVVTDVDVKPVGCGETKEIEDPDNQGRQIRVIKTAEDIEDEISEAIVIKEKRYSGAVVKTFVSPFWTLEYCIALSEKLRKCFYKSVLEALLEQKVDEGVQRLDNYNDVIQSIDTHFSNWSEPKEKIALGIYTHILTGKTTLQVAQDKISKSIIAQKFALNLEQLEVENLSTETSIDYLFKALQYAAAKH